MSPIQWLIVALNMAMVCAVCGAGRLRRRSDCIVTADSLGFGGALLCIGAVVLVLLLSADDSQHEPLDYIVPVIFTGSGAFLCLMYSRCHIMLDDEGCLYTPVLGKTRRYRYDDIEKVRIADDRAYFYTGGKWVAVSGWLMNCQMLTERLAFVKDRRFGEPSHDEMPQLRAKRRIGTFVKRTFILAAAAAVCAFGIITYADALDYEPRDPEQLITAQAEYDRIVRWDEGKEKTVYCIHTTDGNVFVVPGILDDIFDGKHFKNHVPYGAALELQYYAEDHNEIWGGYEVASAEADNISYFTAEETEEARRSNNELNRRSGIVFIIIGAAAFLSYCILIFADAVWHRK